MNSTRKRKILSILGEKEKEEDRANFNVLRIILPQLSFHDQYRLGLVFERIFWLFRKILISTRNSSVA